MKGRRRYLYGSLGLLSLLGFVGVLTQERVFLLFFAFAVDFGHWFRKNDEMVEDYMNRSAALAFYVGMAATGILGTGAVFLQGMDGHRALLTGLAGGFAVAVIVHALAELYYTVRESWGWSMIQNRIKEYRARHNMTQGELADLVGVRRETIGNLEKGRYNPSLVLAWRIAAVFQVTIEEIFTVEA